METSTEPLALAKPAKVTLPDRKKIEARRHRRGPQRLGPRAGVQRHDRGHGERQPDALPEVGADRQLQARHQPLGVDPEPAVGEVDRSQRTEGDRAVDEQGDARVAAAEGDREAQRALDVDDAADDEVPAHEDVEVGPGADRLGVGEDPVDAPGGAVGARHEAAEAVGGLVDGERRHRLLRAEGVDLQQELTLELTRRGSGWSRAPAPPVPPPLGGRRG